MPSWADTSRRLRFRERALSLQKAKLGPEHPVTLASMNNLALSYAALGRHAEALKLYEETLDRMRAKLGPGHPYTLLCMGNIAEILIILGRPSEAMPFLDESLRRAEERDIDPQQVASLLGLRLAASPAEGTFPAAGGRRRSGRSSTTTMRAACTTPPASGPSPRACCRADTRRPDAAGQAEAEAAKAMRWLARAVAAGYDTPRHLAHMARDSDLDALRDRADFRRLLAGLFDRGFRPDPFAADEPGVGGRSLSGRPSARLGPMYSISCVSEPPHGEPDRYRPDVPAGSRRRPSGPCRAVRPQS